jgi:hypothetical protein
MLSNYLQCIEFGNAVIECVREKMSNRMVLGLLQSNDVAEVYSKTPPDCALRRLFFLVHMSRMSSDPSRTTPGVSRKWIVGFPPEFIEDVAARTVQDSSPRPTHFWCNDEVIKELNDV